jgi:hypothetical protein
MLLSNCNSIQNNEKPGNSRKAETHKKVIAGKRWGEKP